MNKSALEREYDEINDWITYLSGVTKVPTITVRSSVRAVDKLCAEHLKCMEELDMTKEKLEKAEKQLDTVKNISAKEIGEAISITVNALTDVICQKLNAADIMDIARRHNDMKNFTAIDKLENVLTIVNHINNSPDNERIEMFKQLATYIQGEIDYLKGDK